MVLLTFDEEESPIRHYYKRHFINRKRVISCQIDPLAFVKVRNYDGARPRVHTSCVKRIDAVKIQLESYSLGVVYRTRM